MSLDSDDIPKNERAKKKKCKRDSVSERRLLSSYDVEVSRAGHEAVKHHDINIDTQPLLSLSAGMRRKVLDMSEVGEVLRCRVNKQTFTITYRGQLSGDAVARSLGYVYETVGDDNNVPGAPARNIPDLCDALFEVPLDRVSVKILDKDKASKEIADIIAGQGLARRFAVVQSITEEKTMHASVFLRGVVVKSLCGVTCSSTNVHAFQWKNKKLGRVWCDLCHAIAVTMGSGE